LPKTNGLARQHEYFEVVLCIRETQAETVADRARAKDYQRADKAAMATKFPTGLLPKP